MAIYHWKVHESSSCSGHKAKSQLVFSVCWKSKDVGSNTSEEMYLLVRVTY